MKTLNDDCTKTFCQVIEKMNGLEYIKLTVGLITLFIEKIGENIVTPVGLGCAYSISYGLKLYHEASDNPEMCFLIVDNRNGCLSEMTGITVAPFMFQNSNLEIFEESIEFMDHILGMVNLEMQAKHTMLANRWLGSFKLLGVLNAEEINL